MVELWTPLLDGADSPAAFTGLLRRLRENSGRTVQAVAARGEIAAGTVQNLCSGRPGAPKWTSVEGFLTGCGVVDRELRRRWREAYDRAYPTPEPLATRPSLSDRLASFLSAQWEDAHSHRYQFFAGHAPTLPKLYVTQHGEPTGTDEPEAFTVREILERSRNVLVVAPPGMGKSTMVNHIQFAQADSWLAGAPLPFEAVLPIAVPAGLLVERSLPEALNEVCERLRCDHLFAGGPIAAPQPGHSWLIMVDGLDEVLTSYDRSRVLAKVVSWIQRGQNHLRFLVATRPLAVGELAELRALRIGEYRLRRFDDADLRTFATNWFGMPAWFLASVSAARLRSVVRVPLLATIAALVFAAEPDRELPTSRAGLYARFVEHLRDGRRDAPEHRRRVEAEFGRYGAAGRRAGTWLQRSLPELLEHLAETQVGSIRPALMEEARRWVSREASTADVKMVAGWEGHLRSLLTGTAVLVERGPDVRFAHQSFAEYLAAGPRARRFEEAAWLADVRSPERRNLALFVLARSDETADRLVRMMLDNGGADVVAAGDVLADGIEVDVPLYRRAVSALMSQVRAEDPTALEALRVLIDLRPDPAVADGLNALVRDEGNGPWVRAVTADALGDVDESDVDLRLLMADTTLPDETRRWLALRFLRRHGPTTETERLLADHPPGGDTKGGVFRRYAIREVSADATATSQDRLTAALDLVTIGDAAAAITLRASVLDPELRLDLRLEAARAWLKIGDNAGDSLLALATTTDADWDASAVAAVALAEAGEPEGRRMIPALVAERPIFMDRLPAVRTVMSLKQGSSTVVSKVEPRNDRPSVWGNVPPRNPFFTGRQVHLDRLGAELTGPRNGRPLILNGVGGVGKTQLAIEYIFRHSSDFDLIWWVPAERPGQILSALTELAARLNLDSGSEANSAVPAVREALGTGIDSLERWLLIFDGAEDLAAVQPLLPAGHGGAVLVTSRNQQWSEAGDTIELGVFSRVESVRLLLRRDPELDRAEADRLSDVLGDLPLAVEQAAAWRATTGMPTSNYLALLRDAGGEPSGGAVLPGYAPQAGVALNVALNLLAEASPAALQMLQVCVFMAAEPIRRDLLAGAVTPITSELDAALTDPIRLSKAIRDLARYALVRVDHGRDTLEIHRLVRATVRERMTESERVWMQRGAQTLLADANPHDPTHPSKWTRYQNLVSHVEASGAVYSSDPAVQDLVFRVAEFLYAWGDHRGSASLADAAYAWRRDHVGEADRATLKMAKWVAWMRLVEGRFAEARQINDRALRLSRETLGDDDVETIDAMRMAAHDLRVSGDFRAARDLDERAVDAGRRALGADAPQTLACARALGTDLRLLGQFEAAVLLDKDTQHRLTNVRGAEDAATLGVSNNVSQNLRELGRYREAHRRQEAVYRQQVEAFGRHAAGTLRSAWLLAVARRTVGDLPSALELSEETLALLRRRYGDDQPQTILTALCHAIDLRHAGALERSRVLHEDTLERMARLYGEHHLYTHAARIGLAVPLRRLGEVSAARAHDERALAGLISTLGPDHPATLVCATNLANDLVESGHVDEATMLDTDTVARSRRVLGVDHPATRARAANLAGDGKRTDCNIDVPDL